MTRKKKITLSLSIAIILSVAILITSLLTTFSPRLNSFTSSNKTAVTIGELWNDGEFNIANVRTLIETLSNNSNGTIDTLSNNIDIDSGDITAGQIRNFTTNKSQGESVIVTLGGFEWIVTYLSKSKDGDVVVTLWLSGEEALDTSTFGNSNAYYGTDDPTQGVPTNMYGTSYIRAKLNNGGYYIDITSTISNPASVSEEYEPDPNYKFADFVQDGVLTKYMVTPEYISWQENGQSAIDTLGYDYNQSNENWTDTKIGATEDSNFYSRGSYNYNYAGKSFNGYGNSTWKGDYLWLPSVTETGYSGTYSGMWDLSVAERSNSTDQSWVRTAYNDLVMFNVWNRTLNASGNGDNASSIVLSAAIRPAFHLNLTSVESSLAYTITTQATPSGYGTVTGGGSFDYNATTTLTATPTSNLYVFDYWDKDGVRLTGPNELSNTLNITVTDNATYTAHFILAYQVTLQSNNTNLGKILYNNQLVDNINISIGVNNTITLYAIPNNDVAFICWQITTDEIVTELSNQLSIQVTQDMTITAIFSDNLMNDIAVTTLGGGEVRMGGHDESSTTLNIGVMSYANYYFDGWYTMENDELTRITEFGNATSIVVNIADYKDKLLIARFLPTTNENINQNGNNE